MQTTPAPSTRPEQTPKPQHQTTLQTVRMTWESTRSMILCLDTHYFGDSAFAAGICIASWDSPEALWSVTDYVEKVAPYIPGRFFERELPCLESILSKAATTVDTLVVDAYVDLPNGPGLGRHLFDKTRIPVVGVAKTRFPGAPCLEVARGKCKPLFVSAAEIPMSHAAQCIASMHGSYRMPSALKAVDALARSGRVGNYSAWQGWPNRRRS